MKEQSSRFFRFIHFIISWFFYVFFFLKVTGRENIPDHAAMVCSPHSSALDPLFLSVAYGAHHQIHYMAKIELFKGPLGKIITKLGAFPVNRGHGDAGAVVTAIQILKSGLNVGVFPEGTRVKHDGEKPAKTGAIRIAEKANCPIVPVYYPRKKRVFSRVRVIIGEPYYVNPDKRKLTNEEYKELAAELMEKIRLLGEKK